MYSSWIVFYEKHLICQVWALQNALKPSEWFVPAPSSDRYVTRRYKSCNMFINCYLVQNIDRNLFFTMKWPAKSPDLNPIEHVWDLLKRKVRAQPMQPNIREITRVIHQMWAAIPQQYLHRYIISMRTRCLAVIAAAGGHTKYWNEIN